MGDRVPLSKIRRGALPCSQEKADVLDDDALADRAQHDFRRVVQLQFLHEIRAVGFDGGQPEIEEGRDLPVRSTFGEQVQDFFSRSVSTWYESVKPRFCRVRM